MGPKRWIQQRSWRTIFALALVLHSLFDIAHIRPVIAETVARGARLAGDNTRVEFLADLSRKVPIDVFTLGNPYRVIVDLAEVKFQFPAGEGRSGQGLVSAYRFGLFAPGKSRIVIDVTGPVAIEQAVVEDGSEGVPARLKLVLAKTSEANFAEVVAKRRKTDSAKGGEAAPSPAVLATPVAPRGAVALPLIILDPGHGGVDPGAIGKEGNNEKDVVLAFAKTLQKKIEQGGRFQARLTREIDTYVPLHDRVRMARNANADLFISLHADSVPQHKRRRTQARGASIYVLSERASDEEAQALASLENRADIIAGVELPDSEDPVSNILIDLAQRETNSLSAFFSQLQIEQMKGSVPMHGDFTRSAGFRVLKAPDIPSALIELGYISNPADEKNLVSEAWRDKVSTIVFKAIQSYFRQQVARSPF